MYFIYRLIKMSTFVLNKKITCIDDLPIFLSKSTLHLINMSDGNVLKILINNIFKLNDEYDNKKLLCSLLKSNDELINKLIVNDIINVPITNLLELIIFYGYKIEYLLEHLLLVYYYKNDNQLVSTIRSMIRNDLKLIKIHNFSFNIDYYKILEDNEVSNFPLNIDTIFEEKIEEILDDRLKEKIEEILDEKLQNRFDKLESEVEVYKKIINNLAMEVSKLNKKLYSG